MIDRFTRGTVKPAEPEAAAPANAPAAVGDAKAN
jgi:hypothetical protein